MTRPISHHAAFVLNAVQSPSDAGVSAVAASWCRSAQHHGLDPEAATDRTRVDSSFLNARLEEHQALLSIANPVLEQIFRAVGRSGCCVVLSDPHGVILQRHVNDGDAEQFTQVGLVEGGQWAEANEGTNGIGTCLVEGRPLIIHRDQHFASRNIGISCMDAPVFDPHGKLIAALDVSSYRDDHGPAMADIIAALVRDAAARIEREYFCHHFDGHQIIFLPDNGPSATALLATDRDGLIIGASRAARLRLGLSLQDQLLSKPMSVDQLLGTGDTPSFEDGDRAVVRQALAQADGNASKAARILGIGRATLYRRMKRAGLKP